MNDGANELRQGILVVDHGSRRAAANERLHEIAQQLSQHPEVKKGSLLVKGAHMELGEPTILAGLEALKTAGAQHIIVVPLMVSPGRHVMVDIPEMLSEYIAGLEGVTIEYCAPLSEHSIFFDLLIQSARKGGMTIESSSIGPKETERTTL